MLHLDIKTPSGESIVYIVLVTATLMSAQLVIASGRY